VIVRGAHEDEPNNGHAGMKSLLES